MSNRKFFALGGVVFAFECALVAALVAIGGAAVWMLPVVTVAAYEVMLRMRVERMRVERERRDDHA